jgi:hypothetical protein
MPAIGSPATPTKCGNFPGATRADAACQSNNFLKDLLHSTSMLLHSTYAMQFRRGRPLWVSEDGAVVSVL